METVIFGGKGTKWVRDLSVPTSLPILPAVLYIFAVEPVSATQTHGSPEGLYVHQMAHLFFLFSMLYLISQVRARGDLGDRAWRYVAVAAGLFGLWNLDTLFVHWGREVIEGGTVASLHTWNETVSVSGTLETAVYLGRMDHLLLVPAVLFLFLGLRCFSCDGEVAE